MKQEDKELLLKDLCARLPYGVKVKDTYYNYDENSATIWLLDLNAQKVRIFADEDWQSIEYIKPYLFPLSSMTEDQEKEFKELYYRFHESAFIFNERFSYDRCRMKDIGFYPCYLQEWLLKNHFDICVCGLIKKGLAIDCTNLNIY